MAEVVIFDLEYWADKDSQKRNWSGCGEHRELMQIGAVVLDCTTMRIVDCFHSYAKPVYTWPPTEHILDLTNTTIGDYENACYPPQAIESFFRFVRGRPAFCYGEDGRVLLENLVRHRISHSASNAVGVVIRGKPQKYHESTVTAKGEIHMAFYGDQAAKAHRLSSGEYHITMPSRLPPHSLNLRAIDLQPWFVRAGIDTSAISSGELAAHLGLPIKDYVGRLFAEFAEKLPPLLEGEESELTFKHNPVGDSASATYAGLHLVGKGHANIFWEILNPVNARIIPFRPVAVNQAASAAARAYRADR